MALTFFRRFTKIILIGTNVCIGLLFLTGAYGNRLNPEHWWFTGYLALGFLYLFVLLAGFLFFWLATRPAWSLISLACILLAWGPLTEALPARLSANFNQQKNAGDCRVMSWNVEHFDILEHKSHPERKQEMLDLINAYQPDIACFQEVVASDQHPDAINYLPSIQQSLGMEECYYSYNPKLDFDNEHHFGLLILSRYPILQKETVSYPPHDYNSTFQWVDIRKGKDTIRVFNIHLQSLRFSGENRRYIEDPTLNNEQDIERSRSVMAKFKKGFLKRFIQSNRIREAIDASPHPVVVCGDFNDVPNSYAYQKIGAGLHNAFAEKGAGTGRTFYSISPTLRIDNIFAGDPLLITQYIRIRKKLSDHFPIVADLQTGKAAD